MRQVAVKGLMYVWLYARFWRPFSPSQICGPNGVRSSMTQSQESLRTDGLDRSAFDQINEDERQYSCPFCSFKRAYKTTVRTHIRLKHTMERPFLCTICSLRFGTKGNLKRHMLVHTGEKPYQCPRCLLKFTQKIHLKYHLAKKFQCSKSWNKECRCIVYTSFLCKNKIEWNFLKIIVCTVLKFWYLRFLVFRWLVPLLVATVERSQLLDNSETNTENSEISFSLWRNINMLHTIIFKNLI